MPRRAFFTAILAALGWHKPKFRTHKRFGSVRIPVVAYGSGQVLGYAKLSLDYDDVPEDISNDPRIREYVRRMVEQYG